MATPRTQGLPVWCTTGDVAAVLGWSQTTIRKYLTSFTDWQATVRVEPEMRHRLIPCVRFGSGADDSGGGWARIPRWWVEEIVALGAAPPVVDEP